MYESDKDRRRARYERRKQKSTKRKQNLKKKQDSQPNTDNWYPMYGVLDEEETD